MVPIPRSCAATSKAHLVRVLVFSKISATFLPRGVSTGIPFFFLSFRSAARSSRYSISSGVKSSYFKKSRPFKSIILLFSEAFRPCARSLCFLILSIDIPVTNVACNKLYVINILHYSVFFNPSRLSPVIVFCESDIKKPPSLFPGKWLWFIVF